MSYLPRMSKTYKEPKKPVYEEFEPQTTLSTVKPASSLPNERTYNPQMILKHYKYIPHAPPVLPGPSVLEEVTENELYKEASRLRRSRSKMKSFENTTEIIIEESISEVSEILPQNSYQDEVTEKTKKGSSKKSLKSSRSSTGKRKSHKTSKKISPEVYAVSMFTTDVKKPFRTQSKEKKNSLNDSDFSSKEDLEVIKREKSVVAISSEDILEKVNSLNINSSQETLTVEKKVVEFKPEKLTNHSAQCTLFTSIKKNIYIIPSVINSLLRTVAFLVTELNKEENLGQDIDDKRSLLVQVQIILSDLCNIKPDKEYSFDISFSDYKRLEKIQSELQKYMKDVYGDKGKYIDKMEDLKKVFIELKQKELEFILLNEKFQEIEERSNTELVLKESDLKDPEVTLQNKRLESEQLLAEVEFSRRELQNCQKKIAELDWELRSFQEDMTNLKKSAVTKSRSESIGKKSSSHRFLNDVIPKKNKSKESEVGSKK